MDRLRESVETLIKNPAPGAPAPPIVPPQDGFLSVDRSKAAGSFATDVNPGLPVFMADSQVPGPRAGTQRNGERASKSKLSWCLVSTEDEMTAPDTQRVMSKRAPVQRVELKAKPCGLRITAARVASLIQQVANGSVSTAK